MLQINPYQQTGYYNSAKGSTGTTRTNQPTAAKQTQKKEANLSGKAQDVLKKLREKYADMDIMVADFNNSDEARDILSRGTKEFSVLFSGEELEKMASDEKYLQEKMDGIDGSVRMSEQINEQFVGTERGFELNRIGIAFNEDGTTTLFAELQKASAKQNEHQGHAKNSADTKRTTARANSMEELFEKIKSINWDKIKAQDQPVSGSKCDYSV